MNLRLENISKIRDNSYVLHQVSGTIASGEVLAFIGPSGSGKTTLLRCLNGLELPEEGHIWIDNQQVTAKDWPYYRKKMGMLFQNFQLFPHMSVLQNVTYAPMRVNQIPFLQAKDKAEQLLEKVGMLSKARSYPHQLSGGEKQRVAIARALVMEPEVLLFDEPTSALDPERVQEVLNVIQNLAHTGLTMLLSTHEMGFAKKIADHVWFLNQGKILEQTKAHDFFKHPTSQRAQQFLNSIYAQ